MLIFFQKTFNVNFQMLARHTFACFLFRFSFLNYQQQTRGTKKCTKLLVLKKQLGMIAYIVTWIPLVHPQDVTYMFMFCNVDPVIFDADVQRFLLRE